MKAEIQNFFLKMLSEVRSGEPLQVGKGLTKSFGIVVAVLAVLPQQTAEDGWQIRILAFLLSPANEIGDTFAGIAGVLAFLWIIITVWLQSEELSEQREEMKATRIEFQKMAEAQEAQVSHLIAQSKLFLDEKTFRDETRSHLFLNAKIDQLRGLAQGLKEMEYESEEVYYMFEKFPFDGNEIKLSNALLGFYSFLPDHIPLEGIESIVDSETYLYETAENVSSVARQIRDDPKCLSDGDHQRIANMNLDSLILNTDRLHTRWLVRKTQLLENVK